MTEMSFWDHLDELRKVLFRSAIFVVLIMVVAFLNKSFLFDGIILAPTRSDFSTYELFNEVLILCGLPIVDNFQISLINIELSAQFFTHLSISFYTAIILSMPFLLYQIWAFLEPALYDREKRIGRLAFGFASILFFMGVLVGYFLVFPMTLHFLGTYQVSELVANQISLKSYISMFIWLILMMGVVFEMPALAAILSRFGLLTKEFLKKYRRHALVIIIIIAAVITPSGDPFTLLVVVFPMYLLYELSILVCKNTPDKNISEDMEDIGGDLSSDNDYNLDKVK